MVVVVVVASLSLYSFPLLPTQCPSSRAHPSVRVRPSHVFKGKIHFRGGLHLLSQKSVHLSNIFLLNIHFSVCDEKKRKKNKKHDVSSFQQQKQRKQREVSKKTTTFLQSTFTNITTCRRQNER